MNKKLARLRRARKTRAKIADMQAVRLCVHRSNNHIYAGEKGVLAQASSVEAEVRSNAKYGNNVAAAAVIGKRIAEKAKAAGIEEVAFDRSGFKYHGRVKALAEAARENGLKF